ncbi:MAG: hydrogenase maturation nickel metallochaperone HypA [Methanolinea sp.]|jgi:hydrogenase nickel incorporation protein HypA/HybF
MLYAGLAPIYSLNYLPEDDGASPPAQSLIPGRNSARIPWMHEYSIAYDIYATAKKAALDHGATEVKLVSVEFGEMAMVNPEQVEFLFNMLIEDDLLMKGAGLACTVVPPVTSCSCGYEGTERFVCPRCGGLPHLVKGREILVTNVEIEVEDT